MLINNIKIGDLIGVISIHSYPRVIREAIVEDIDGSLLYLSDHTTEHYWDVKKLQRTESSTVINLNNQLA